MPRGDRSGPFGFGPGSGRGAGYCGGSERPGYDSRVPGAGLGLGAGRGWRRWFRAWGLPGWLRFGEAAGWHPTGNPRDVESEYLTRQKEALERELDFVKNRLNQVTSEKNTVESQARGRGQAGGQCL